MIDVFFSPESSAREVIFYSFVWLAIIAVVAEAFLAFAYKTVVCFTIAVISFAGAFYVLVGHSRWITTWETTPESFLVAFVGIIFLAAGWVFRKRLVGFSTRFRCLYSRCATELYFPIGSIASLIGGLRNCYDNDVKEGVVNPLGRTFIVKDTCSLTFFR